MAHTMNDGLFWQGVAADYISQWERQLLTAWLPTVFGGYAIQLGHHERLDVLAHNHCTERYRVRCVPDAPLQALPSAADAHDIRDVPVADFAQLPFDDESIDLVILPHTLDEHADPHGVLREAYRVLRPSGRMMILGFNPVSLWGVHLRYQRMRGRSGLSNAHAPIPVARLSDWIELLNCDVTQGRYGCYAPPCSRAQSLARWSWMEKAGDRWWGFAGAVYALMVEKRVYSPTLVGRIVVDKKPRWSLSPAPAFGAVHNLDLDKMKVE